MRLVETFGVRLLAVTPDTLVVLAAPAVTVRHHGELLPGTLVLVQVDESGDATSFGVVFDGEDMPRSVPPELVCTAAGSGVWDAARAATGAVN